MQEVFTEIFHSSAVVKIKVNAFGVKELGRRRIEDLVIIYEGSIAVFMEGNDLVEIIQQDGARLRLIKWDLSGESLLDLCIYGKERIVHLHLNFRKKLRISLILLKI